MLSRNVTYRLVIGERGNGKSYAVKERCVNRYYQEEEFEFLYIRRCKHQKTRANMQKVFNDINKKIATEHGEWVHYSNDNGFYMSNNYDFKKPFGHVISIEEADKIKSIPLQNVKVIFFDEFLEYGNKIANEEALFLSIISTVVRDRDDIEIFMCGNTVTKYSPYFTLFGIDLGKMKQGKLYTFAHENGVTGAIEWCESRNIIDGKKLGHKYLGFDNNPSSNMILYGDWEYDNVNISNIDGIGWNCRRRLVPIYLTAKNEVFEFSIYQSTNPILFIRKINTQNGFVRQEIKYNLSYDNSLVLNNKNGIVPMYKKINGLIKSNVIQELWRYVKLCLDCGRVVYDTLESGSDFSKVFKDMK